MLRALQRRRTTSLVAALVADAGHACVDRFRMRDVKTSVGAGLSLDLVGTCMFPFMASMGAAWGYDGAGRRDSRTVYLQVGRAFWVRLWPGRAGPSL
jgi:hypothetical protein